MLRRHLTQDESIAKQLKDTLLAAASESNTLFESGPNAIRVALSSSTLPLVNLCSFSAKSYTTPDS